MKDLIKVCMGLLLALSISGIAACGKTSQAVPVEGSGYPHSYPRR